MAATTVAASGGWLTPRQAFAVARNIVDLIRDEAAKAPIKVHKLHSNVSILEGSGGNIAVLTGVEGKVFIDAGITASRPRIREAANGLSRDPIKHLINTHWHFDHTDGNQWLNAEGAAIMVLKRRRSSSLHSRKEALGHHAGERLELLKELVPSAEVVTVFCDSNRGGRRGIREVRHCASSDLGFVPIGR